MNELDYSSDDDSEKIESFSSVLEEIKENDDFDHFLDVYVDVSDRYVHILKWLNSYDVYNLCKNPKESDYYNPLRSLTDETLIYYYSILIWESEPNIKTDLTDSMLYNFHIELNRLKHKSLLIV
jgi:hypothetical protein